MLVPATIHQMQCRIWLHLICMQVANLWSHIKAEPGWINFQSLIFINSGCREKKYKAMTQLPLELQCRAIALQSQAHATVSIDQERRESLWSDITQYTANKGFLHTMMPCYNYLNSAVYLLLTPFFIGHQVIHYLTTAKGFLDFKPINSQFNVNPFKVTLLNLIPIFCTKTVNSMTCRSWTTHYTKDRRFFSFWKKEQ